MNRIRTILSRPAAFGALAVLLFCLAVPFGAQAALNWGPIVPPVCNCPGTAAGYGCVILIVRGLVQIAITIGVVVAVLALVYAGFTWVTSPINSEGRSRAKNMLINVAIGLVIVLAAYLIVDYLMSRLYNPNATYTGGVLGPWNAILGDNAGAPCIQETNPKAIANPVGAIVGGTINGQPTGNPPAAGTIPAAVCSAAAAYQGASTAAGPDGGNKACAWAVNNVLSKAGVGSLDGASVSGMESALQSGRGVAVAQSAANCGDIVVEGSDSHVGICLNSGCTQVISNSSSHASFTWISGPTFAPSYGTSNFRIYRVVK